MDDNPYPAEGAMFAQLVWLADREIRKIPKSPREQHQIEYTRQQAERNRAARQQGKQNRIWEQPSTRARRSDYSSALSSSVVRLVDTLPAEAMKRRRLY